MQASGPFRRLSKRTPWIEFALALFVLIAIAVASDAVTASLESAQYWVVHTHEVETATAQVRGDVVAAGNAREIYIITGDSEPLAEYERAKDAIPGELTQLQQLTSDNSTEQANVIALRELVGRRLGLLEQSIALREQAGADSEQQKQWTRDGQALQNQALAIFDRMKVEEERLMTVRQTISSRTYRTVRFVLLGSFALVVLLLSLNFYDLSRELKERRQAEEDVQRLSRRMLRVQDEERRRVARELHDSIGQIFAVLKMNLEMLSRTFATARPEDVKELIAQSTEALEEGLSGARTLSHLLHPPLLDEIGFTSAAKWLVDGFSGRSKIKVKLEFPENITRLPQDVELTLFRVLQESLTNIHKHSGSKLVEIRGSVSPSSVTLSIQDHGVGIPAGIIEGFKNRAALGVGLAGMRERVRDLGGLLELKSDGTGAMVEVRIPLPKATPVVEASGSPVASSAPS